MKMISAFGPIITGMLNIVRVEMNMNFCFVVFIQLEYFAATLSSALGENRDLQIRVFWKNCFFPASLVGAPKSVSSCLPRYDLSEIEILFRGKWKVG